MVVEIERKKNNVLIESNGRKRMKDMEGEEK